MNYLFLEIIFKKAKLIKAKPLKYFNRISWLPVWEDTDEMDFVYGLLCDLLEANSPGK